MLRSRCALLLLVAAASFASTPAAADAQALFDAGDFAAAIEEGRKAATGDGFAAACSGGLVLGSYLATGESAVAILHGAIEDCARAIDAGSDDPIVYINYAVGLSFEAKRLQSRRYAIASRRLLEDAVALYPTNAFPQAALAGWHTAVSEEGLLVRAALGASRAEARKGFATAVALAPESIPVSYEHLRHLAAGDRRERAEAALAAATLSGLQPQNALEEIVARRARDIADALAAGGDKTVAQALARTEPFPDLEKSNVKTDFAPPYIDAFPSGPR